MKNGFDMNISGSHKKLNRKLIPGILFLLCFLAYSFTLSRRLYGYEDATLEYFRNVFFRLDFTGRTPAGLLALLFHVPAEIVNLVFVNYDNLILRDFISAHTLPFTSALICLAFFFAARDLFESVSTSVVLSLLLAFGTMIWPYSKMGMELQHTLWTIMAVWMIIRWHKSSDGKHLVLAGLFSGFIILTKIYGVITCGAISIYILIDVLSNKDRRKNAVSDIIRFSVPVVFCIILFLLFNYVRYGSMFLGDRYNVQYETKKVPLWEPLYGFFFSSGKSIFIYNPVLLISLFCIKPFFKNHPRLKYLFLLVFGFGLIFHSLFWIWTDETWGPRKLHYLVPLALLPAGYFIQKFRTVSPGKKSVAILIVILSVFVQILGISFSYEWHPVLLQGRGMSSLQNLRYNPDLSHTTANYTLLLSAIDRYIADEEHYFVYEPIYFATVEPDSPLPPVAIPIEEISDLDFWFIDNRAPRDGELYLSSGARIYLSLIIFLIPLLFFILFLMVRRKEGATSPWRKTAAGWTLLILALTGPVFCIIYNRAYAEQKKKFMQSMENVYDIAIGHDPVDKNFIGSGWRGSEWMQDPKDPQYEVPFRWTSFYESYLYFPTRPNKPYSLTLQMMWVWKTRMTVYVNGHAVKFIRGKPYDNKTVEIDVPAGIIGGRLVSEILIHTHDLHIPAVENPEKSKDTSTLGVMAYGARWELNK